MERRMLIDHDREEKMRPPLPAQSARLRAMGSIGASELVVIALIGLLLLGPPIAVLVWLVRRSRKQP
jgi:hypothetical protein